jgi:hypothetical protein
LRWCRLACAQAAIARAVDRTFRVTTRSTGTPSDSTRTRNSSGAEPVAVGTLRAPATVDDEGLADAAAANPFRSPRLHPGIDSAWGLAVSPMSDTALYERNAQRMVDDAAHTRIAPILP